MTLNECYNILGISKNADLETVKRAYRKRAFELHPDLNPNLIDAGKQFQLLNEAYVNLIKILSETTKQAEEAYKKQAEQKHEEPGFNDEKGFKKTNVNQESEQKAQSEQQSSAQQKNANEAYSKEEVLKDILGDPFARRVFEDIFSELNKTPEQTDNKAEIKKNNSDNVVETFDKIKKVAVTWGDKNINLDFTGGIGTMMRSWFKRQIDEELTMHLPANKLFPGARVRLQIRQGLSKEPKILEVSLPDDFKIGQPIRLKGLGKKIGSLTGDLYLKIEAKN